MSILLHKLYQVKWSTKGGRGSIKSTFLSTWLMNDPTSKPKNWKIISKMFFFSGYQVMRLATELVPALASLLTPKSFSPFWVVMFYLSMIVFGLGQHMALFNTISSGLIAIRPEHFLQFESSLIFMSCLLGLVFCFPLATEVRNWIC